MYRSGHPRGTACRRGTLPVGSSDWAKSPKAERNTACDSDVRRWNCWGKEIIPGRDQWPFECWCLERCPISAQGAAIRFWRLCSACGCCGPLSNRTVLGSRRTHRYLWPRAATRNRARSRREHRAIHPASFSRPLRRGSILRCPQKARTWRRFRWMPGNWLHSSRNRHSSLRCSLWCRITHHLISTSSTQPY